MWQIWQYVKVLVTFVFCHYHRIAKWFLRRLTGLCELQRIVYGELRGSRRIGQLETCLVNSRNPAVRDMLAQLDSKVDQGVFDLRLQRKAAVRDSAIRIAKSKSINIRSHLKFVTGTAESLECIWGYRTLNIKIDLVRSTKFDPSNPVHEKKLMDLWTCLMGPEILSGRVSRQWQTLGFQGSDPATDFRGAGFLALEMLLYLGKNYQDVARQLLSHALHPQFSYPFALLAIHMTFMCYDITRQGLAKNHFYNRAGIILEIDSRAKPTDTAMYGEEMLGLFYEFCCALMVDFDAYWFASKPKDIMEYGRIKKEFDLKILRKLKDDRACFLMEVRTM